jgi:hypothetical protein
MGRLKYIAKTMIMTAVLLLAGYCYVNAQNTGAGPYLNSWHTYRVIIGNSADTRQWDITDGTITMNLTGAETWCDIAALSGSNADISICFTQSVFTVGSTWLLRYREISASTGVCTSARQFTINITENNFYLSLSGDDMVCKPESGQAFRWEQLDGVNFPCSYNFIVTMHKEASFAINYWSFDALIASSNGTHSIASYSASVITANGGTASITDVGGSYGSQWDGNFKVQVSAPTVPNLDSVAISVTLTLNGYVYNGVSDTLKLFNGSINSGSSGLIISPDNTSRPMEGPPDNVLDATLRDRLQIITFLPLPATPNITIVD